MVWSSQFGDVFFLRYITPYMSDSSMSRNKYVVMEQFEKEQLHQAKACDPRFAEPSRITDGGYVALLAQQAIEEFEEGDN